MTAIRVRNPDAFDTPMMADLFDRAFASPDHPDGKRCLACTKDIIGNDDILVLVGIDGSTLNALAVISDLDDPFVMTPYVLHTYSESPEGTVEIAKHVQDWLWNERGKTKIRWINLSGHTDESYIRLIETTGLGRDGKVLGGLIEFDLEAPEEENHG